MYAEAGLQLPAYPQGSLQEVADINYHSHHSQHPLYSHDSLVQFHVGLTDCGLNLGNMVQAPVASEYDMGERDFFIAPEPIFEEPLLELDPVAAAMSIISNEDDVTVETIKIASGIESIQDSHGNELYECKKDLLEESEIEDSISELLRVNIPTIQIDEVPTLEKLCPAEGSMQKSVSSGCLNSVDWIPCCSTMRPDFLDLQGLDIAAALGLRRAYSEGDIQNLGNTNTNTGNTIAVCSSFEQLLTISDLKTEQRQKKLTRYREKKSKRNFVRKIKYVCRKALADSQPRVRGRFAKAEESETPKPNMLRNTELGEVHKLSAA